MVHAHASQNSYGVQMKMRTPDDIPPIHLVPHTDTFNSMFCFNRFFFFWFVSSAFVSFTHSIVIRCSHYFLCIVILAIDFLSNLFCSVLFFVINASPRIVLINVSQVESIACRFLFHASICWLTEINHCWHAFFFLTFLKTHPFDLLLFDIRGQSRCKNSLLHTWGGLFCFFSSRSL